MSEIKDLIKVEDQTWGQTFEKEPWVVPLVNIFENTEDYFIVANFPGVTKDNIKVKLENNSIVIMGRVQLNNYLNSTFILKETELGNYYRKFNLSDSIDYEKIEARYDNGQLTIRLPKHEKIKPKTIEIN